MNITEGNFKGRSLVFEAILYITFYYIAVAIVLFTMHLVYEFHTIRKEINTSINDLLGSSYEPLVNSVWEINQNQTQTILKGVNDSPLVIGIQLTDPDSEILHQSGNIPKDSHIIKSGFIENFNPDHFYTFKVPLFKKLNGTSEFIGTLSVFSGNQVIYDQLSKVLSYIIITTTFETISLWFVIVIYFNRKIKRPFNSLVQSISEVDPQDPTNITLPHYMMTSEVHKIVSTFNKLISELRNFKAVLEAILDNKTEMLKEKNIEVRELLHKLEQTQEHLINQEKLNSLGLVSAGIAHELKNPLNISLNSILILKDIISKNQYYLDPKHKDESEKFNYILNMIESNNKKMENIIRNMLLQSRTQYTNATKIALKSFVETNLKIVQKSLKTESSSLAVVIIDISDDLNVFIYPNEFGRLLVNMFENSFHALEEKYLAYKEENIKGFTPEIITKAILNDDNTVTLSIKDNGIGIPADLKNRVMEPFFTTKPPGIGTGLGMHLVYEIVKKHKGQILIDSIEGKYTHFDIIIPSNLENS